jgi:hypothetical protein
MLDLVIIDNPRTAKGGWENEKDGCSFCGAISCAYIAITVQLDEDLHVVRICGSCLNDAEKKKSEVILAQCVRRV